MKKNIRRIIIAGSCSFNDYGLMCRYLDKYLFDYVNDEIEIVSGHASGADSLGERYATEHNIKLTIFEAKWKEQGRKAGPIRNTKMVEYAYQNNGELIAFWNGKSHGTMDTINKVKRKGMKCNIVLYESDEHNRRVTDCSNSAIKG